MLRSANQKEMQILLFYAVSTTRAKPAKKEKGAKEKKKLKSPVKNGGNV